MADEVKVSKATSTGKRISKFYKEVRRELRKVIWPNRTQLINNTVTVLASCLVVGALIWVVDAGLVVVTTKFFAK
jgi:preprotein translocase subunit SecE